MNIYIIIKKGDLPSEVRVNAPNQMAEKEVILRAIENSSYYF